MTNPTSFRHSHVLTAALVAAASFATACVADDAGDEPLLEEATSVADEITSARQAIDAELTTADEIDVAEDASEYTLCALYSSTFPEGDFGWAYQTPYNSCIDHRVDLNRYNLSYPAHHWSRGEFPQYSGSFSLDDLMKCTNSYIKVERWHGTVSANIALTPQKAKGVYKEGGDGVWRCTATFATWPCGTLGYDKQRVLVVPVVNNDPTAPANGARVTNFFAKEVTSC